MLRGKVIFIFGIILTFIISGYYFYCKIRHKEPKEDISISPTLQLPYLTLNLGEGTQIISNEIKGKVIFVLFQPDCDHCQREATAVRNHLEAFKDYSIYFISSYSLADIIKFGIDYKLDGIVNIHFAQASSQEILKSFGAIATPSLYIYSSEGRLKKAFNGETSIEVILKEL